MDLLRSLVSGVGSASRHCSGSARRALSLATQGLLMSLAFLLALGVRFDLQLHTPTGANWLVAYFLPLVGIVVGVKLLVFLTMGIHRLTWRYVSLDDLLTLLGGSQVSLICLFVLFYGLQYATGRFLGGGGQALWTGLPESVFLLDWVFGLLLLGGARVVVRLLYEESRQGRGGASGPSAGGLTRLLIIGAGDAAETVLRELGRLPDKKYRVVGLLDDSPAKQRGRIHGVPVLGQIGDLPAIAARQQVAEVLIALPSASKDLMQRIVTLCRATQSPAGLSTQGSTTGGGGIRFRTIPSLAELLAGSGGMGGSRGGMALHQIRDVSVNDILGRDAVQTDLAAVGAMLHGQVVLVSGAGGSIGSEICRTIAGFSPATLVLLDKAENAIFEIDRELRRTFPLLQIVPAIGDISDPIRVDQIFSQYAPNIVFHAAAHKHVPLAELNPGEAIRNNVFGTKTLADTSLRWGVKNFVMISTDKAVNPTSIMGATKRCAEIYIQSLARRAAHAAPKPMSGGGASSSQGTNFITVRFGNVLGSNGSVVPIFKQQIAAGGPVTVTHPEMRRYFMTIPEACQLVLQAGALGQRGEIFVLDMGQPVRILDLARDLIVLSGLRPEIDIPIVFTGLRPGEKLFEELSIRGEDMVLTRHPKIAIWKSTPASTPYVNQLLDDLEPLQHCTDRATVLKTLTNAIPEMKPWEPEARNAGVPPARTV